MKSRVLVRLALTVLVLSLMPARAWAHSAYETSTPRPDAVLDESPGEISVAYTEPPTTQSVMTVTDGCGTDVTGDVEVLNDTITAAVTEGQPGRWRVEWEVISAVDGHLTRDGIAFDVSGASDCETQAAPPEPEEDEDSGIPVGLVLAVAGAAAIAAIAFAAWWALRAR